MRRCQIYNINNGVYQIGKFISHSTHTHTYIQHPKRDRNDIDTQACVERKSIVFHSFFSVCLCLSIYPFNANRDCRAMACETKRYCSQYNADLMCIAFNFDADAIMTICVCGMNTEYNMKNARCSIRQQQQIQSRMK